MVVQEYDSQNLFEIACLSAKPLTITPKKRISVKQILRMSSPGQIGCTLWRIILIWVPLDDEVLDFIGKRERAQNKQFEKKIFMFLTAEICVMDFPLKRCPLQDTYCWNNYAYCDFLIVCAVLPPMCLGQQGAINGSWSLNNYEKAQKC